jgi:hypothetical protein
MFDFQKIGAQLVAALVFMSGIFAYLANRDRKVRKETLKAVEAEHSENVIENMEAANEIETSNTNASDDDIRNSLQDEWA